MGHDVADKKNGPLPALPTHVAGTQGFLAKAVFVRVVPRLATPVCLTPQDAEQEIPELLGACPPVGKRLQDVQSSPCR